MKPNKILNRISSLALAAAALFAVTALTACSSDTEPASAPDPIPDGMANITISVATPSLNATRADVVEATEAEVKLKDLFLFVFQDDGAGNFGFFNKFNMSSSEWVYNPNDAGTIYRDHKRIYQLSLPKGDYKFYILANTGDFANDESGKTLSSISEIEEDDLRKVTLNFIKNNQVATLDMTESIPMVTDGRGGDVAAVYKDEADIEANRITSQVYNSATGVIKINEGKYIIRMDVTFVVSKVRYTILYDGSDTNDISSWAYEDFDVTNLAISNINNNAYTLFSTESALASEGATGQLSGVKKTFTGKMEDIKDNPDAIANNAAVNWTNDVKKRAYQGSFYIPINTATELANKTKMTLKYKVKERGSSKFTDKDVDIYLPNNSTASGAGNILARGHYYDVVVWLTSTGADFNVGVKKWAKNDTEHLPL